MPSTRLACNGDLPFRPKPRSSLRGRRIVLRTPGALQIERGVDDAHQIYSVSQGQVENHVVLEREAADRIPEFWPRAANERMTCQILGSA